MKQIIYFIPLLVFLSGCLGNKSILDGEAAFKLKQYQRANELLLVEIEEVNKKEEKSKKAFLIAQTYEFLLQPQNATQYYEIANQNGYGVKAKLALAYAYKINKEYRKSVALFTELAKINTLTIEANRQIRGIEDLTNEVPPKGYFFKILNLSMEANTSVYSPVFYSDDELLVSADGPNSTGEMIYSWTGRKHSDLYTMSKYGGTLKPLDLSFNTSHNEGSPTLNRERNELFFTRCYNKQPNADEYCSIFYSKKDDNNVWSEPVELPFFDGKTNFGQPTLVENDSVIVFSSLSEGGQNGYDLWYSDRFDGAWSEPFPMPTNINTQGNEYFPTSDGDTLYFSSDFHLGLGGLDIFKTWLEDGKWSNPIRLESPINSSFDDYSYITDKTVKPNGNTLLKGYFSSNRGGKGLDEVYLFEKLSINEIETEKEPVIPPPIAEKPVEKPTVDDTKPLESFELYLAGRVIDGSSKGNPFMRSRPIPNARIIWKARDTLIEQFTANRNGIFIKNAISGKVYDFIASADSFLSKKVTVLTTNARKPEGSDLLTINFEIPLDRIIRNQEIVLNNIYYDLDKSFIRNDAKPTLDSLASILILNPSIQIELGSHTDCQGADDYNLELSQRRAQAAVEYLISKGIEVARLSAKGYGELSFAINCVCEQCTEDEHQRNRRTTFKIQ
jgi:outer membrane protein OmpA-like peptidoglycan-associated protein